MTISPQDAASLFGECRSSKATLSVESTGGVMPDFFDAIVTRVGPPSIVSLRRTDSGQEFSIDLSVPRIIDKADLPSGDWTLKMAFLDNSWMRFSTLRL